MKLTSLVEVRDLETNRASLFLRFQTEDGRSMDLPASTAQVEAILSQMPAPPEVTEPEEEEHEHGAIATPGVLAPVLGSTDSHLRLASFTPPPAADTDADPWGLG